MSKLTAVARNFARDEQAASTAEYGVVVAVVVLIAAAVMPTLRTGLDALFLRTNANMLTAAATTAPAA
jgi:Flp pilus assembly pilin Flp